MQALTENYVNALLHNHPCPRENGVHHKNDRA